MDPETITIGKGVYDQLVDDSQKLGALEAGGVDNWDGYDDAMVDYRAWKKSQQPRGE